jgi:hypothetical protein
MCLCQLEGHMEVLSEQMLPELASFFLVSFFLG